MTKKVLIITQSEGGGLRRHITDLIDGLLDRDLNVVLIFNSDYGDETFLAWVETHKESVTLYDVKTFKREIAPLEDLSSIVQTYKVIKKERPTVIHTHSSKAGVVGRISAKMAGIDNVFYTPHAYAFLSKEFSSKKKILFVWVEKILSKYFTKRTFNVSYSEKEAALENKIDVSSKFKVILNAVPKININWGEERKRLSGDSLDKTIVLNVARVTGQKNPELFTAVAEAVGTIRDDIQFIWAGNIEDDYKELASNSQAVTFLGEMKDTNKLVGAADIYFSSSHFEGLSYSLLEAASFGIPVFASNVPGNVDFSKVYKNADMFDLKLPVAEIADNLIEFIEKVNDTRELGKTIAPDLSYDDMVDQIVREYGI